MNEKEKSEQVLEAIEKITAGALEPKKDGVNLLAIVKKLNRNRKKGESPE